MTGTIPVFQLDDERGEKPLVDETTAEARSCLVRIYPAAASGALIELDGPRLTVGRDPLCDVALNDDFVSRVHAVLEQAGGSWRLSDHGSMNGTVVNDAPVEQCPLTSGDEVRIGNHIFRFLSSNNMEAEYHDTVYEMMTVDALTGTFNRRYFEEVLRRDTLRAVCHSRPMALLLIDVDCFEDVNDQFGHLVGDEVLRVLSERLRSRIGESDVLARIGGEAFAVAMPEIPLDAAIGVAEDLRLVVDASGLETSRGMLQVTISIGVAHYCGQGALTSDNLMERADRKLHEAKRAGRNCVRF